MKQREICSSYVPELFLCSDPRSVASVVRPGAGAGRGRYMTIPGRDQSCHMPGRWGIAAWGTPLEAPGKTQGGGAPPLVGSPRGCCRGSAVLVDAIPACVARLAPLCSSVDVPGLASGRSVAGKDGSGRGAAAASSPGWVVAGAVASGWREPGAEGSRCRPAVGGASASGRARAAATKLAGRLASDTYL